MNNGTDNRNNGTDVRNTGTDIRNNGTDRTDPMFNGTDERRTSVLLIRRKRIVSALTADRRNG